MCPPTPSIKASDVMLQNCKDLIERRIIGRYGNYLAKTPTSVISKVTKSTNANPSLISSFHEYWKWIHQAIKKEQSFIQQQKAEGRMILRPRVPNIEAVQKVARGLSFDKDELLSTIAHYAEKHEFRFSDLTDMMRRRHSQHYLARTIYEDLKYLDNELDGITGGIAYRLRPIIVGFKYTFFTIKPCEEEVPDWWSWDVNFLDVAINGAPVMISQEEIEKAGRELRKEKRKLVRKLFGWSEKDQRSSKRIRTAGR